MKFNVTISVLATKEINTRLINLNCFSLKKTESCEDNLLKMFLKWLLSKGSSCASRKQEMQEKVKQINKI